MQHADNLIGGRMSRSTPKFTVDGASQRSRARKIEVLGAMRARDAARYLETLGDKKTSKALLRVAEHNGNVRFRSISERMLGMKPRAYQYTEHAFGFVDNAAAMANGACEISDAREIAPDDELRNLPIKITLDTLRTFEYPGGGEHQVLFNFEAQHQSNGDDSQAVKFAQTYRARDGSGVGVSGYPIFIGLRPAHEGVGFTVTTTNVKSGDDQRILGFLGSGVFKEGLKLTTGVNPVIPVVAGFATGIAEAFARRNENKPVQSFYLGLDFSGAVSRAKLREGVYICVQVPDLGSWDWSKLRFRGSQIVFQENLTKRIELNYLIFSVSKITNGTH